MPHCWQQQGLNKCLLNELITECEWDQREVLAGAQDKQGLERRRDDAEGSSEEKRPRVYSISVTWTHLQYKRLCYTPGFPWINLLLPLCPETINTQNTESFLKFIVKITKRALQRSYLECQIQAGTCGWEGGTRVSVLCPNSQNKRMWRLSQGH